MEDQDKKENSLERPSVGVLASGEKVYDRPNGHIHETIKNDVASALQKINAYRRDFVSETVTLEGKEWKSLKVTFDPETDKDDLFLARRVTRKGLSVFIKNREPGTTNQMVIILSKNNPAKGNQDGYTILSAFSGDPAPREPWDSYFNGGANDEEKAKRRQEKEESLLYWTHHAFIPDDNEFPIDKGTEQPYNKDSLKYQFLTVEEKEKQIVYSGLFVTNIDELVSLFPPKHGKVFAHHSTTEFMPKSNDGIEIGKAQKLKIIGRASNEKGDALLVENPKSKNKYPHITLSCAEGVSPVYSNQLLEEAAKNGTIEYFPEPVFIDVVEGYENGNRKTVVTDKFLVSK